MFRKISNIFSNVEKNNYLLILFILLILCLALVLRWHGIDRTYWFDEANTIFYVNHSFDKMIEFVEYDFSPPLYYVILYFWIRLFNDSELVTHMLSLIFGVLSVVAIYFAGKDIFNKKVGLWSALLLAVSPYAIYYSQEARMYSLVLLISIILLWSSIKILDKRSKKYHWLLYFIIFLIGLYTHYFYIFLLAVFNLFVLFYYLINKKFPYLKFLLVNFLILLVYLPWLFIFFERVIDTMLLTNTAYWLLLASGDYFVETFLISIFIPDSGFGISLLYLEKFLITFMLIGSVIKVSFKEIKGLNIRFDGDIKIFLLIFTPVAMILICYILGIYNARYLIIILPFLILLMAKGICNFNNRYINIFILFFIVLILLNLASVEYILTPQYNMSIYTWPDMADYIEQNEGSVEEEVIFMYSPQDRITFNYYYDGNLDVVDSFPNYLIIGDADISKTKYIGKKIVSQENLSIITRNVSHYNTVWVVKNFGESNSVTDPECLLQNWFESNFSLIDKQYFPDRNTSYVNQTVSRYQRIIYE